MHDSLQFVVENSKRSSTASPPCDHSTRCCFESVVVQSSYVRWDSSDDVIYRWTLRYVTYSEPSTCCVVQSMRRSLLWRLHRPDWMNVLVDCVSKSALMNRWKGLSVSLSLSLSVCLSVFLYLFLGVFASKCLLLLCFLIFFFNLQVFYCLYLDSP